MHDVKNAAFYWSDELACAILSSIPDDEIERLWLAAERERRGDSGAVASAHRDSLIRRFRTDPALRFTLMQVWRKCHAEVVDAAQIVSIDGSEDQCEAILRQFRAEEVLLELITDEHDDGWALAQWTVDNVKNDRLQRDLVALLDCWSGKTGSAGQAANVEAAFRIVVFGGHQRDESKMNRRLFENSPFDVRWKPCEKHR